MSKYKKPSHPKRPVKKFSRSPKAISIKDLQADCIANMKWQWDDEPDTCMDALQNYSVDPLVDGQSWNENVQNIYKAALQYYGPDVFF